MTLWEQHEFDVMAQQRRGDSIRHVGSIWAPSRRLAAFYASVTYDEQRWHTLYVVDRADTVPVVVSGEAVFEKGGIVHGKGSRGVTACTDNLGAS